MRSWWARNWAQAFAWVAIVLSVVAVVGVVVFALPAYQRTQTAAEEGQRAQSRLVRIAPVTCKNYRDQLARGVISPAEFVLVTRGLAVACPPLPQP